LLANFRSSREEIEERRSQRALKTKVCDVYQTLVVETKQPSQTLHDLRKISTLYYLNIIYMMIHINTNIKISLTCALFFGFFPLIYTNIYANNTNKWNKFGKNHCLMVDTPKKYRKMKNSKEVKNIFVLCH
jgi:hypothetical protein